jgi:type I restriction enzyme S subunit
MNQINVVSLESLIHKAPSVKAGQGKYQVLSMTMRDGLVEQASKFKKRVASQDLSGYKVVRLGQLVVGFPIDEGVLAVQDKMPYACVSPAYNIWNINQERVNPRFLHLFLRSERALSFYKAKLRGTTARRRTIPDEVFLQLDVPLPSLEEQQRIAAILDKCNAIQAADRKRREILGRFQASHFRHLFGEPSAASENWPLKTVESCSAAIQTGPFGSLLHQSDYIQGGIPILNPKHIVNGVIACGENETIGKDKAGELIGYQLEEGDVLLARRGEMGRCAVVTSKEDGWLCGTGSMFIRPLGGTLAPEYLCALLSSQYMRSRLEKIAIGTTLLNLNAKIVGELLIPVPPIDLQHRYADVLARLSALGDAATRSALSLSTATASIQNELLAAAGS